MGFFESIRGGFHAKALLLKEEQENKTNGETEAEKKAKPKKKSKISEDITVELLINDILDPTTDQLASSKKRSNNQEVSIFQLLLDSSVWRSITYSVSLQVAGPNRQGRGQTGAGKDSQQSGSFHF